MLTEEDIKVYAETAKDVIDLTMKSQNVSVKSMYIIGSYASNTQTEDSDLDLLAELQGGNRYPRWSEMQHIRRLLPQCVHIIYGTEAAQRSYGKPYRKLL